MRINLEKVLQRIARVAPYPIAIGSLLIIGLYSWETRTFVGDDLEVFNAMNSGVYLSTWAEILRDSSLDKWRPLNNIFLFITVNLFENSYPAFWFINSLLIALLGACMIVFLHTLGFGKSARERIMIALGVVVIVTSPMTFFSRQGLFGFLEIAPLIFSVAAYGLYLHPNGRRALLWSAVLLALATLTHERYLVLSLGLAVAAYVRSKSDLRYKNSARRFLIFPALWIYTTVIALGSNPLRGGGEQALNDSAGPWLLGRFFDVVLLLSGSSFGNTVQMDPEGFTSLILGPEEYFGVPLRLWSLGVWALILLPSLSSLIARALRRSRTAPGEIGQSTNPSSRKIVFELTMLSGLILLPAATIVSRIEMRWLFGSLVLGVLALLVAQFSGPPQAKKSLAGVLTLVVALFVNSAGWPYHDQYNMYRTNTYGLIDAVQGATSPATSRTYSVFVSTDFHSQYLAWSTNYGRALTQGDSKQISEVTFNPAERTQWLNDCTSGGAEICLDVVVTAESFVGKIATTTSRVPFEQ